MTAFDSNKKHFLKLVFLIIGLFFCIDTTFAQGILTINATQSIHFGSICITGPGGTVTLGYDGQRSSTGNVLLLSVAPTAQPAIFEIKLCEAGIVTITYDATTVLTGSNKESSLTMDIGPTEKGISGSSFMTNSDCNIITTLLVGGTLHIPDLAVPGTYSGSFAITFNQQ